MFLRKHIELSLGLTNPEYSDEPEKVKIWTTKYLHVLFLKTTYIFPEEDVNVQIYFIVMLLKQLDNKVE